MKQNNIPPNSLMVLIAWMLPVLLLSSACRGFQLLEPAQTLPKNEAVIEERILSSFEPLIITSTFRSTIDASQPTLPLGQFTISLPMTIEMEALNHETTVITTRVLAENWESIHVNSIAAGDSQAWLKSGATWEPMAHPDDIAYHLFLLAGMGNPYASFWSPPSEQIFRSRAIRTQETETGLAEIYEVSRHQIQADGTLDIRDRTEVWLDADTGEPILSVSESFIITYEVDESIEIEMPLR